MNQFGIRPLCPTPGRWLQFIREDAYRNRNGDAFGIEIPFSPILPIETGARERRVRQPGDRDVVEDVVACEAVPSPSTSVRLIGGLTLHHAFLCLYLSS
jgi:hypothetical protein